MLPSHSHSFHSSAIAHEKKAKLKARIRKKANLSRRQLANEKLKQTAPDPVRGYGPNNDQLWLGSDLRKVLLSQEEVWKGELEEEKGMLPDLEDPNDEQLGPKGNHFMQVPVTRSNRSSDTSSDKVTAIPASTPSLSPSIPPTPYLNFALTPSDALLLFEQLPKSSLAIQLDPSLPEETLARRRSDAAPAEASKAEALMRIVDLRNTNARGIRFENTRRIVRRFGQGEGVGRVEVQGELLMPLLGRANSLLKSVLSRHPYDAYSHTRRP